MKCMLKFCECERERIAILLEGGDVSEHQAHLIVVAGGRGWRCDECTLSSEEQALRSGFTAKKWTGEKWVLLSIDTPAVPVVKGWKLAPWEKPE